MQPTCLMKSLRENLRIKLGEDDFICLCFVVIVILALGWMVSSWYDPLSLSELRDLTWMKGRTN